LRSRERFAVLGSSVFAWASLSLVACSAATPDTGATAQSVISHPPPNNLNFALYASTSVSIGTFAQVIGDVGSAGFGGSVLFDQNSVQGASSNVLANTVQVNAGASVGIVFGNDLALAGSAAQVNFGLDPTVLPVMPAVTPPAPGATAVSVPAPADLPLRFLGDPAAVLPRYLRDLGRRRV
jgi:hypothetical protein